MNGLLWAAGWALAALGVTVLRIIGGQSMPVLEAATSALVTGGITGFMAGTAFSLTLSLVFRNRSLQDVSVAPFTLAGAAVAAALLPGSFFLVLLLSGSDLSVTPVLLSLAIAAGLGGSTAFGMIKLAKAAPDELPALADGSVAPREIPSSRSPYT